MYNGKIATNDDDFISFLFILLYFRVLESAMIIIQNFFSNNYIYRKKIIIKITINVYSYYEWIIWP